MVELESYITIELHIALLKCTGVLWSGATSVIEGAQDAIKLLRSKVSFRTSVIVLSW